MLNCLNCFKWCFFVHFIVNPEATGGKISEEELEDVDTEWYKLTKNWKNESAKSKIVKLAFDK